MAWPGESAPTRPIRREDVVGTTPQQQLERLRQQVLQGLADDLVVVGHDPATESEIAAAIFFGATGALNDAIETGLFGNDELAHTLLQVRPRESSRTGNAYDHCDRSASCPNGWSNETLRNRQLGCPDDA